jgi:hypothetical protein
LKEVVDRVHLFVDKLLPSEAPNPQPNDPGLFAMSAHCSMILSDAVFSVVAVSGVFAHLTPNGDRLRTMRNWVGKDQVDPDACQKAYTKVIVSRHLESPFLTV